MDTSSFFGKLFDFSFKEFITLQIIKYLYVAGIIFSAITAIGMLFGGFAAFRYDALKATVSIILSPIVFLILTVAVRLALEAIVATFRIAENTSRLVEQGEKQ
jgi:hypothetical protein